MMVLAIIGGCVLTVWAAVLWGFRASLVKRWNEPAFLQPIVIFESDDWGAGPLVQAEILEELKGQLQAHSNRHGEVPVMTIGVILAAPTGTSLNEAEKTGRLESVTLDSPVLADIVAAMQAGVATRVFDLQLHGYEHFNRSAFLAALRKDAFKMDADDFLWTESLPSPLQSAWVNGSVLPSHSLDPAEVKRQVAQQKALWEILFNSSPHVAVPTTFVWTSEVERALASEGVRWLVTPGRRYTARDANGQPGAIDKTMLNGAPGEAGLRYVVRDVYFEPSLGHTPTECLAAIAQRHAQFRPALVEIHRFNFCGPRASANALQILEELLRALIASDPTVRFLSTAALCEHIEAEAPEWVARGMRTRFRAWLARIGEIPRFRKVAILTGLWCPLWLSRKALA